MTTNYSILLFRTTIPRFKGISLSAEFLKANEHDQEMPQTQTKPQPHDIENTIQVKQSALSS